MKWLLLLSVIITHEIDLQGPTTPTPAPLCAGPCEPQAESPHV